MIGRRTTRAIYANPVYIGALAVIVVVVSVFVAYNANKGLPFLPQYRINIELPSASQLGNGNEIRIAGVRVGQVESIEPVVHEDGSATARITAIIKGENRDIPVDSTAEVRARSLLGVNYVAIREGSATRMLANGATIELRNTKPTVALDQFFNTFDRKTRKGARDSLRGFGNALAGRGHDLNTAIEGLNPLLGELLPVVTTLADPRTGLGAFVESFSAVSRTLAPVAPQLAHFFVSLDVTASALATVTASIEETIAVAPGAEVSITRDLPTIRPFLLNTEELARELAPATAQMPEAIPPLARAVSEGAEVLPGAPAFNAKLTSVLRRLQAFSEDPNVPLALEKIDDTFEILDPTLAHFAPAQTECNYLNILLNNLQSMSSEGDSNGTWLRLVAAFGPAGPNAQALPSSVVPTGPPSQSGTAWGTVQGNYLHTNPYPYTAAPGEPRACVAGNEEFLFNQSQFGNPGYSAGSAGSASAAGSTLAVPPPAAADLGAVDTSDVASTYEANPPQPLGALSDGTDAATGGVSR